MFTVLTTISEPTASVRRLADELRSRGTELIVVGDLKGPHQFELEGSVFLSLRAQRDLPFRLATLLPTAHYARKNLGYLWAFSRGATCLYETDDDNAPNSNWHPKRSSILARTISRPGWINVYRFFTDSTIWPRGLPLKYIHEDPRGSDGVLENPEVVSAPIQQGLVDLSPDVDAVWRLVCDRPFHFEDGPSISLSPGTWCPFNSQNTWWWPEAYSLMYLPSHCSFRMTDIWRSFIAQRCLWAADRTVVFHAADAIQERNEHDLQKDFEAEIPGYTGNDRLVRILDALTLAPGLKNTSTNLVLCYEALCGAGFFPKTELSLVEAWVEDLGQCDLQASLEPTAELRETTEVGGSTR